MASRRLRPRFSLLVLMLGTLFAGSCLGLWWRWAPWALVHEMRAHKSSVHAVGFSPDGQLIASRGSDDRSVSVWDAATGQRRTALDKHLNTFGYAVFSNDSRRLAISAIGDLAQLWDAGTGKLQACLEYEGCTGGGAVWSPDDRWIATFDYGDSIIVWSAETGNVQAVLTCSDRVASVAFSPDGQRIATGDFVGTVGFWDTETGRALDPLERHVETVWVVGFSPDGRRLLSASEDLVLRVTDLETLRQPFTVRGHRVLAARFGTGAQTLEAWCMDNRTRTWSVETGELLATGHGGFPIDEDRTLDCSNGHALIVDVTDGHTLATLKGRGQTTHCAEVSPQSDRIVTGHVNGTVAIWHRRRPEWWWGLLWLPESWLALLSAGALAVIAVQTARTNIPQQSTPRAQRTEG